MSSLQAVLFDLDGTLFDRFTSVCRCVADQHARFEDQLSTVAAEVYLSRFLELDGRGYVKKDAVYTSLVAEFGLPTGLVPVLYDDFHETFHRHAVAFPGLHRLLAGLKERDMKLGLVTNGGESHQGATIAALSISHFFDTILISEVEGIRKPDVRIFHRALERVGVPAGNAVFVGDHPEADIAGARAAGITTVWKRDNYWGKCEAADFTVEGLDELGVLLTSADAIHGQATSVSDVE